MNKKNKFNPDTVFQANTGIYSKESWLKIRKKKSEQCCSNCMELFINNPDDTVSAIQVKDDKGNRIETVCNKCSEMFKQFGAADINKSKLETATKKAELIAQLKCSCSYSYTESYLTGKTLDELEALLQKHITTNEKLLDEYMSLPKAIKTAIRDVLTYNDIDVTDTNLSDFMGDPSSFFADYDSTIGDSWDSRWWNNITVQKRFGNKVYSWEWAESTGDSNARDLGWQFDINTVREISEEDLITDTEILDWLENLHESVDVVPLANKSGIRDYVKQQIIKGKHK